jgi:hypothetical protein
VHTPVSEQASNTPVPVYVEYEGSSALKSVSVKYRPRGATDWKRIELARTLSAWLGSDRAVMLAAVRSARAKGHGEEAVAAWLVEGETPVAIGEPRLSTTYDAAQRQQRAGLELWIDEQSEFARRASGKVLCGTTLDLGDVVLNSAFFGWRMEGREGVGRYDVMRRAGGRRGK